MLNLTDNAVTVIERLVTRADEGTTGGIRIESVRSSQPSGLEVQLAPAPQDGDQVVEKHGARVYLDAAAAAALSSKELDAVVDEGSVKFMIRRRG